MTDATSRFECDLDRFYELNPEKAARTKSRAENTAPRIRIERVGRFTYLQGLLALARHTMRPLPYVISILLSTTGCVVQEISGHRVRLRGQIAARSLKMFQNAYLKRILCKGCQSPQTILIGDQVSCSSCGSLLPDLP